MIKKIEKMDEALLLIRNVYLKTEAKNDTKEGQNEFLNVYMKENNDQVFYGYYMNDKLVGIISYNDKNYIKYLFVDPDFKNKRIGSSLLKYIMEEKKQEDWYLDSSVYAYHFYLRKGFVKTHDKITEHGMGYIPMKYKGGTTNV